jgi:DNA-binding IclR family transcriptional regulator
MTVVLNTAEATNPQAYSGTHPVGSRLPVHRSADGKAFVEIRDVHSAELIVLTNHPEADEGTIL